MTGQDLLEATRSCFPRREAADVIRSHAEKTGLFDLKHLLWLRAHGGLDYRILKSSRTSSGDATPISTIFARLICGLPRPFLETAIRLVRAART